MTDQIEVKVPSAYTSQLILNKIWRRKGKNRSKCLILLTGCKFNYQIWCCSSNYGKYEIRPEKIWIDRVRSKVVNQNNSRTCNHMKDLRIDWWLMMDKSKETFFKRKERAENTQYSYNEHKKNFASNMTEGKNLIGLFLLNPKCHQTWDQS